MSYVFERLSVCVRPLAKGGEPTPRDIPVKFLCLYGIVRAHDDDTRHRQQSTVAPHPTLELTKSLPTASPPKRALMPVGSRVVPSQGRLKVVDTRFHVFER